MNPQPKEETESLEPEPPKLLERSLLLRRLAVSLWAGFLGAMPMMVIIPAVLPADMLPMMGMAGLSQLFFAVWACAAVAAAVAVVLTHSGGDNHGG